MAVIKFNLRELKEGKLTPVILRAYFNGIEIKCKTGEKILPEDWDKKTARPISTKANKRLNTRLDFLQVCADNTHKYFIDVLKQVPTAQEYQNKFYELAGLEATENKQEPANETLISFISKVINEAQTRQNDRTGKNISLNTIKVYKQCLRLLTEFNKTKRKIDFQNIDLDFFHDFKSFMIKKNYSQNTIAKHFITLKSFINEATERGINSNHAYKSKRFRVPQIATDTIYLSTRELTNLYELDLVNEPSLDRVRDLFLVGCYTGLRFSDFSNLGPENIKTDFLQIRTQKTNEEVIIPIHPQLMDIMSKYKGKYPNSLPPAISNQKMNDYLKKLGAKIEGLTESINITTTKGNLTIDQTFKKFEKISTHTARRSFATNLYKEGFPPQGIMKITGHRTEKAFLRYIRVTPQENAEILKLHWAKMSNLKVS
jgi:integrase